MKQILSLIGISALVLAAACDDGSSTLTDGRNTGAGRTPNTTEGDNGDFTHNDSPSAPGSGEERVDPVQVHVQGSPEVTSRLHGCGKLSVASIGQLLQSRGLTGQGAGRPQGTQNAQQIFQAQDTAAALGAANYNARVPEAPFATTSAVSKMFDMYTMASYDAVADNWTAPACPGVKVIDAGKFTKDGITCLIGKPASDEHVAIANDAITKNPTDGAKIAIAALLSAAHTCQ